LEQVVQAVAVMVEKMFMELQVRPTPAAVAVVLDNQAALLVDQVDRV
jgi:hypothetical protein